MVVEVLKTIITIRKLSGPEICHGAAVIYGVTSGLDHITNSDYLKRVIVIFFHKKSAKLASSLRHLVRNERIYAAMCVLENLKKILGEPVATKCR